MTGRLKGATRSGVIVLAATLAGCSSSYREGFDALKLVVRGAPKVTPTAQGVESKPYFQMLARSRDGQALMILGGVEGQQLNWYDSRGEGLFILNGEIVRTIGLNQNLDSSHWLSANPFEQGLQHLDAPFSGTRIIDWSPGYRYGVQAEVHLVPAAMEDVVILGTVHHLRRIDERVSAPSAGFAATNHYWVDPADGLVWKSRQTIASGITLDTVMLRPYRGTHP